MRILKLLFFVPLFVVVAYCVLWGSLALWFKLPVSETVRTSVALAFGVFGIGTLIAFFYETIWRWLSMFSVVFLALVLWWNTLIPPSVGDWSAEVSQQVSGTIEGDILTLTNVRDFQWRTEEDFDEAWVTRSYDLSQIESLDLFMSYWGGPHMAHLMLSFGFSDGEYLAWSVEVRREKGEKFSPVADFFKAHSLSVVAGTEQDVVGLRSNIQLADVYLYRIQGDADRRRDLLERYVRGANRLTEKPAFFHSLLTNCSRTVILLARSVGADIPADWRILVNGYFPSYLYDQGALGTELSFEEVKEAAFISDRALAHGLYSGYPDAIRTTMQGMN